MIPNTGSLLKFGGYLIPRVELEIDPDSFNPDDELVHDIEVSAERNQDNELIYRVSIQSTLSNKMRTFKLVVAIKGMFELSNEADLTTRSLLIEQNAAAILYPFLRASVASITAQTGIAPIMLPVVNFTQHKIENTETDSSKS